MSEDQNLEQFINTSAQSQEGGKSISDYKNKESKERHYYGDALNDDNVNDIVDEVIPHVVVLVGFPEYGKSTFVASFYHALLTTGKIGKYKFVDSDTIAGFERRAHVRNLEIKLKERLDRTPVYADYFLSVLFQNEETDQLIKIVLSDRSGESYQNYAKNESAINQDRALKYANHILFFLDAAKTASNDGFFELQTQLNQLTIRMNKYGAFSDDKRIDVVFNKIDLVAANGEYRNNKQEILKLISRVTTINKEFELSSKQVPNNEDLNKFFIYLLESCANPKYNTEEDTRQLDWVNKELANI